MRDNNILPTIPLELLGDLGKDIVRDYEDDLSSRSEWELNNETYLNLFLGHREPKSRPHLEYASNVVIPMLTTACLQFQARAYQAMVPGKDIIKAWPTDGQAVDAAKRVTKHMNWQLFNDIPLFIKHIDKLCIKLPLFGSVFKKTYYDPALGKIQSRVLQTGSVITSYNCDDIEECKRISHIYELEPWEVMERIKKGIFLNHEALLDKSKDNEILEGSEELDNRLVRLEKELEGFNKPFNNKRPRLFIEQHCWKILDNTGIAKPYIITVDKDTQTVVRIESRLYKDPITKEMKVWESFTEYNFIPNPISHYGYGFGILLRHLNEAANSIINELIDAGTLNNMQSGFVDFRSGLKKMDMTFQRGEFKSVNARSEDIKKDIYMFDFKPPSSALFSLLGLIHTYAKELSSVSDTMLGKMPSSDTAATSFMSALEQGLKVFSVINTRMHESFRMELQKLFLLNRLHLKEKVYFLVQDSTGLEMKTYQTGKLDYMNNIDIMPVSNPMITSKMEQAIKAEKVFTFLANNPLTNNDTEIMLTATKDVLNAYDVVNVSRFIPKKEKVEPKDYPPEEENARFLTEQPSEVLPKQNHLEHIDTHNTFGDSLYGSALTPQGVKMLKAHIQQHWAAQYINTGGDMEKAIGIGIREESGMERGDIEKELLDLVNESKEFTGGRPSIQEARKL